MLRFNKRNVTIILVGSLCGLFSNAGTELDKVRKIGTKYCNSALIYLVEPSLPEKVKIQFENEKNVFFSLCSQENIFVGKPTINYPDTIPVNLGALLDSWKFISGTLRANKEWRESSTEAATLAARADILNEEAISLADSISPIRNVFKDEYSQSLVKQGITSEKELMNLFNQNKNRGLNLNKLARENK